MRDDDQIRVLMYSHDTFGLGHLRRTRAIAHALVEQHKGLSVLIISGSSIAGAFDFRARVDFIKIPSVIKLYNGEYTSLSDHIDLSDTLAMRRSVIESAAVHFRPDVFIVDKEPRGLRGELDPTLPRLKELGTEVVLGLREVLDEPDVVKAEWERNDAAHWVATYYDRIWVYGSRDFWDPLTGVPLPETVRARVSHVGFLARTAPQRRSLPPRLPKSDYILVTAGGGGDGSDMMRQVLAAKEHDRSNRDAYVLVLGPFMPVREQAEIRHRANRLDDVHVVAFDSHIETLIEDARAVVSMGGYNTFCELMSFNKRALIIPRKTPRQEQLIRAEQAAQYGLIDMLDPDDARAPWKLAERMRRLPLRPLPWSATYQIDLDGLDRIGEMVGRIGDQKSEPTRKAIA
ncbi:MAG: glycosyltransferase [Pseudomonadota bacterium]